MALYFFDFIDQSTTQQDDTGTECASIEEVCKAARDAVTHIAKDAISADGDRRFFTVLARDDAGRPVYTATLTFSGLGLDQRPQVGAQAA